MALLGAILLAIFVLPPAWRVPVVAAGGAIEVGESFFWIWLSKRRRPSVGVERLVEPALELARALIGDGVATALGALGLLDLVDPDATTLRSSSRSSLWASN